MGIDTCIFQHPGVDVDVFSGGIVDLHPLTHGVGHCIRVLHNLGDDNVPRVGRGRLDDAYLAAAVSGVQVAVVTLFPGVDGEVAIATFGRALATVIGASGAVFNYRAVAIAALRRGAVADTVTIGVVAVGVAVAVLIFTVITGQLAKHRLVLAANPAEAGVSVGAVVAIVALDAVFANLFKAFTRFRNTAQHCARLVEGAAAIYYGVVVHGAVSFIVADESAVAQVAVLFVSTIGFLGALANHVAIALAAAAAHIVFGARIAVVADDAGISGKYTTTGGALICCAQVVIVAGVDARAIEALAGSAASLVGFSAREAVCGRGLTMATELTVGIERAGSALALARTSLALGAGNIVSGHALAVKADCYFARPRLNQRLTALVNGAAGRGPSFAGDVHSFQSVRPGGFPLLD